MRAVVPSVQVAGVSFSNTNYDNWNTNTNVSSHLCCEIKLSSTDPAHIAKNKE